MKIYSPFILLMFMVLFVTQSQAQSLIYDDHSAQQSKILKSKIRGNDFWQYWEFDSATQAQQASANQFFSNTDYLLTWGDAAIAPRGTPGRRTIPGRTGVGRGNVPPRGPQDQNSTRP